MAEVTRLATTIVWIAAGRVNGVGRVREVMGRAELYPLAGRFEAGAVLGMRIAAHDLRWSLTQLTGDFGKLTVPRLEAPVGTALRVRIRARDVILAVTRPTGISALNVLAAEVERLVPIEEGALEVQLRLGGERPLARRTRFSSEALGLAVGSEVLAVIKTVAIDRGSLSRPGATGEV